MGQLCKWFFNLPPRQVLGIFALGSIGLVVMAFVLEYGFNALPCQMCWWQRYGHWAMAGIASVTFILPRIIPPLYGLVATWLAALYGLIVAIYQMLVQWKIVPLPEGCGNVGLKIEQDIEAFLRSLQNPVITPSCDRVDFTILSLSLAEWNAIVMTAVLVVGAVYIYKQFKKRG